MRSVTQQPQLLVFDAQQVDSDIDHSSPCRLPWGHGNGACVDKASQQTLNTRATKLDGDYTGGSIHGTAQCRGARP